MEWPPGGQLGYHSCPGVVLREAGFTDCMPDTCMSDMGNLAAQPHTKWRVEKLVELL